MDFPLFPQLFDDLLTKEFFNSEVKDQNTVPSVNIKETETSFDLELAAPGMNKEDFKVQIENDVLTVSAERQQKNEEKTEDGKYSRKEFSYHSFKRMFTLPENMVESDNVSATYKDGILQLSIPKKEIAKVKAVKEIKVA
jgi:HSP20 family protein